MALRCFKDFLRGGAFVLRMGTALPHHWQLGPTSCIKLSSVDVFLVLTCANVWNICAFCFAFFLCHRVDPGPPRKTTSAQVGTSTTQRSTLEPWFWSEVNMGSFYGFHMFPLLFFLFHAKGPWQFCGDFARNWCEPTSRPSWKAFGAGEPWRTKPKKLQRWSGVFSLHIVAFHRRNWLDLLSKSWSDPKPRRAFPRPSKRQKHSRKMYST